jgi:hypothetical protein
VCARERRGVCSRSARVLWTVPAAPAARGAALSGLCPRCALCVDAEGAQRDKTTVDTYLITRDYRETIDPSAAPRSSSAAAAAADAPITNVPEFQAALRDGVILQPPSRSETDASYTDASRSNSRALSVSPSMVVTESSPVNIPGMPMDAAAPP